MWIPVQRDHVWGDDGRTMPRATQRRGCPAGRRLLWACALALGCEATPSSTAEAPEPPPGSTLVLEIGDLEVYDATSTGVCGGTLRRIELHAKALEEMFDVDAPVGRVFLYDDLPQLNEDCDLGRVVGGCTFGWGARASARSVRHELVHVFVRAATGRGDAAVGVEEGMAWALDGTRSATTFPTDVADVLAAESASDLWEDHTRHMFAWALDRYGPERLLEAHVVTALAIDDGDDVPLAFAGLLGFDSVGALQSFFEADREFEYPPFPDTTPSFTAAELLTGVEVDGSCAGSLVDGPLPQFAPDGSLSSTVRLELPTPGTYEIEATSGPNPPLTLWYRAMVPNSENHYRAAVCEGSWATPRYYVDRGGAYEVEFNGALDSTLITRIDAALIEAAECPP